MSFNNKRAWCVRTLVFPAAVSLLLSGASSATAEDKQELVVLQWLGGGEAQVWADLEAAFEKANPGLDVREIKIAAQSDARGGIRTALLGGVTADILINTWPSFRTELVEAGIVRPVDEQWDKFNWSARLSDSWRALGQVDGKTYGIAYTYGDRSGIFYKPSHFEKAGISVPTTWEEFLQSFSKLKAAGYNTPVAMPAKSWAHGEWFETLLMRTAGIETVGKLARHEIKWTDPAVKAVLTKISEMLSAGCCADVSTMLANNWDAEADQLFQADTRNYLLIGMWANNRARNNYGLAEGKDYSLFQFPALGLGNDNDTLVDGKEVLLTANGKNPEAADRFVDFLTSREAAEIIQKAGLAVPTNQGDTTQLGPVQQIATGAVSKAKVHFVLGDLLPGDLVDEYRVQLQKFLQDPSDANADTVLAAIEAKALSSY